MSKTVVIMEVIEGNGDYLYGILTTPAFKTQIGAQKWLERNPQGGIFQIVTLGKRFRTREVVQLSIIEVGEVAIDPDPEDATMAPGEATD